MVMNCCPKEFAVVCEIVVCVDTPAPHNPGLYQRLRFGLLASSWLPSPLGIFLWSALHVMMLIVCGPAFWALGLLTAFLFVTVYIFGFVAIYLCSLSAVLCLLAVVVDLILLFGKSIRFCWSVVCFLACHEPIVEWKGGACWTFLIWKDFKTLMTGLFWVIVPIGVPCMSGSLYKETMDRRLKTWARWFKEVVHMHDATAL